MNTSKFFTNIFLLLLVSLFGSAQCLTECGPGQMNYMDEIRPMLNSINPDDFDQTTYEIPVQIHIVRNSNGYSNLTIGDIEAELAIVNQRYAPNNMSFFQCGSVNYINNNTYYNGFSKRSTSEFNMANNNNVGNVINIYFGPNMPGSYSAFPSYLDPANTNYNDPIDWIIMKNSQAINTSTLAHEIGHYFNLYHTHEIAGGYELPNGSNCGPNVGDELCDTPADPNLASNVDNDNNCGYTAQTYNITSSGVPYVAPGSSLTDYSPDTHNIMSYSRKVCRDFFSPEQYARILQTYLGVRSYLNCPQGNPSGPETNLYCQGFETTSGWSNVVNGDDIDWTQKSGSTTSSSTGPSSAYEGTKYVYVESSGNNIGYPNKVALLNLTTLVIPDFSTHTVNFDFNYHMYGSSMGTLKLKAYIAGSTVGSDITLWEESGNQGNAWYNASVNLDAYKGETLFFYFEGTTANSYRSDMAVDNIKISQMAGTTSPCPTVDPYEPNNTVSQAANWVDNSITNPYANYILPCLDNNDKDFFKITVDGLNYYIEVQGLGINGTGEYILQVERNDCELIIETVPINGSVNTFLRLYSSSVVELETDDNSGQDEFSRIVYQIPPSACAVSVLSCQGVPYLESFEGSIGDWTQATNDDLDWTVKSGGTNSGGTGPTGAKVGNYYIYVEASGSGTGYPYKKATITSPCFDLSNASTPLFNFDRHMMGNNMGTLTIDFYGNGQWFNDVAVISNQTTGGQSQWGSFGGSIFLMEPGMVGCDDCQIRLRAETGNGWSSDIAIDGFDVFESGGRIDNSADNGLETVVSDFNVFPNPAKDQITLQFEDVEQIEGVYVTNMLGQRTILDTNSSSTNGLRFDVSNLNSGYYIITVAYNFGKIKSQKLLIE